MEVGIYTFAKRHGRPIEKCGSSVWRGKWYWENWEEAEEYKEGKKYDVVIFQKAWIPTLYEQLAKTDTVVILDICDPEWLGSSRWPIVHISTLVDGIVCSSEGLRDELQQFVQCPVYFVDDRVDLKYVAQQKKKHAGPITRVGWFGYSGNGRNALRQVLPVINRMNVNLHCIAEQPIDFGGHDFLSNAMYDWETLPFEMMSCDVMVNPPIMSALSKYKSKNKTYLAWSFGMPVAETESDLKRWMDEEARKEEADRVYNLVREKYHVGVSIEEYKTIIDELCQKKKSA